MNTFETKCSGMTFRRKAFDAFVENTVKREVSFEREKDNQYDPNAIKVLGNGEHIAYIPASLASVIAPKLDAGEMTICCVDYEADYFVPQGKKRKQPYMKVTIGVEMG